MKKNYLNLLVLLLFPVFINAQNIWGVGSGIDIANAEFSNSFAQATSFSSGDNPTIWTALSGSANAFWVRSSTGTSQGAYFGTLAPIASPSNSNGCALFDSDYLDNGGTPGNFGGGPSPSPHTGYLISPRMDLTGYTDELISVRFFSYVRFFGTPQLNISFSTDDGATWGPSVSFSNIPASNDIYSGYEILNLPSSTTSGLSNLTQCRLRFTFTGDYYFSMIDDITIGTTATLSSNTIVNTENHPVKVYPNPTKNQLNIETIALTNPLVEIFDANGRILKTQILNKNSSTINIENLESGIYLFKIKSAEGTYNQQIIKN